MQLSRKLWLEVGDDLGRDTIELEEKGGLVVASSGPSLESLAAFAREQTRTGIETEAVEGARMLALEPHLNPALPGGVFYPEDMQVQPVLAAAEMLAAARSRGARFLGGREVTGLRTDAGGRVTGVETRAGAGAAETIEADVVVNAAGTWGGELGRLFGAPVPVLPRRGFVLITEPLPPLIRRKVYTADYVANVASSDAGLETSVVVEATKGGTVLIGASRERVDFDTTFRPDVIQTLARGAVEIFPFLAGVNLMRTYRGFRPYCPDHLPVIGADSRVPGVYHACGHEGAGIGLSPATGYAITEHILGRSIDAELGCEMSIFSPSRFHDLPIDDAQRLNA
jgi:glycine/D-amino acid oxidase-like deaminating enzyme